MTSLQLASMFVPRRRETLGRRQWTVDRFIQGKLSRRNLKILMTRLSAYHVFQLLVWCTQQFGLQVHVILSTIVIAAIL